MDALDQLAINNFTGRIVRKDLSKKIKGSSNLCFRISVGHVLCNG